MGLRNTTVWLIVASIFLGIVATIFNAPVDSANMGAKIGFALGITITPWVCAVILGSSKWVIVKLLRRNISYNAVVKFDVGVFIALSFALQTTNAMDF